MSISRSILLPLTLLLLPLSGCGSGSNRPPTFYPIIDEYANTPLGVNAPDCTAVNSMQFVSPSGQTYACTKLFVGFNSQTAPYTSGTYTVETITYSPQFVETTVETGTWTLQGNILTCTGTKDGKTMTAVSVVSESVVRAGYMLYTPDELHLLFTDGAYAGKTVTYYATHPAV